MLLKIGLTLSLAYIFLGATLYIFQRKLIYYPTLPLSHPFHEFALKSQGENLNVVVANPGRPQAAIYFGGNAEIVEQSAQYLSRVLPNVTIYLLNYRGYGKSSGSPSEAAFYVDAVALYDAISATHERISVIGRSLGSSVATWLLVERKLHSAVLITPFDSVRAVAQDIYWFFPVKWLLKDTHMSIARASAINSPVLIITAEEDETIPSPKVQGIIRCPARRASFTCDDQGSRTQ